MVAGRKRRPGFRARAVRSQGTEVPAEGFLRKGWEIDMHALKRILCLACACAMLAVFSGASLQALATETNLPDSFLIGDQNGVQVGVDGTYYIEADVMPGDVITKKLTIQNLDRGRPESDIPYVLSMLAEPLDETGPLKLLDEVHMEFKLDGKEIYSGLARGNAAGNDITQRPLVLGEYKPGDQKVLEIKFTVNPSMQVGSTQSVAHFAWHFYAVRAMIPDPPKTGDVVKAYAPYLAVMGGMLLFCFTLVALKKKKEERAGAAEA